MLDPDPGGRNECVPSSKTLKKTKKNSGLGSWNFVLYLANYFENVQFLQRYLTIKKCKFQEMFNYSYENK